MWHLILWNHIQINSPPPWTVKYVVIILNTTCIRSSIVWALKLIFLILASEDPECAPCPIVWDYTVTPTAEDVEATTFRAPEMAASGASTRIDFVEVVSPKLYYGTKHFFECAACSWGLPSHYLVLYKMFGLCWNLTVLLFYDKHKHDSPTFFIVWSYYHISFGD